MSVLPDDAIHLISQRLSPIDRLRMHLCCRRFHDVLSRWKDIVSVDIRLETYGYQDTVKQGRCSFSLVPTAKSAKTTYRVRLSTKSGEIYQIRTSNEKHSVKAVRNLFGRVTSAQEITVWKACLGEEFSKTLERFTELRTLRLWNSAHYFDRKNPSKRLLRSMFSLPRLQSVLILDSTCHTGAECKCELTPSIAKYFKSPLLNLQISGLKMSWRALDQVCHYMSSSLQRLAIGYTFGKESRRDRYITALSKLSKLEDLDLPPHIFHLNESVTIDPTVSKLLNRRRLTCIGFRHYNSAVLFRFIEEELSDHIRLLRIHHNSNRIPNFAQLGVPQPLYKPHTRKTSCLSRQSFLGSENSVITSSAHSLSSSSSISTMTHQSDDVCMGSTTTGSTTVVSDIDRRKLSNTSLASRRLTIFAIEESKKNRQMERTSKIRRRIDAGVEIYFVKETMDSQEVFGRMAGPVRSPYVYSNSAKSGVRIIKGDIVQPIPLTSLGMESDYEMSDWEDS